MDIAPERLPVCLHECLYMNEYTCIQCHLSHRMNNNCDYDHKAEKSIYPYLGEWIKNCRITLWENNVNQLKEVA